MELDGKSVLLTGGTAGIGREMAFQLRSKGADVVLTGRNAAEALIEAADLVTEMELIKHPFRSGVKAQAGVEF